MHTRKSGKFPKTKTAANMATAPLTPVISGTEGLSKEKDTCKQMIIHDYLQEHIGDIWLLIS